MRAFRVHRKVSKGRSTGCKDSLPLDVRRLLVEGYVDAQVSRVSRSETIDGPDAHGVRDSSGFDVVGEPAAGNGLKGIFELLEFEAPVVAGVPISVGVFAVDSEAGGDDSGLGSAQGGENWCEAHGLRGKVSNRGEVGWFCEVVQA